MSLNADLIKKKKNQYKYASHLMWVPVGVKNNYSVGRLQIEAEASSPCAQEKNKVL